MRIARAIAAIALASCGLALAAEDVRAYIEFAEGRELAVIDASGKSRKVYDPTKADLIGLEVKAGESVMTDASTIAELTLMPRGDKIRIGKSTWFRISGVSATGANLFTLEYGKIRSTVSPLAATGSFSVKHETAAAGVRGTDFGMEVTVAPGIGDGSRALIKVYCFKGLVEFSGLSDPPASSAEKLEPVPVVVLVAPNELVSMPAKLKEGEKPLKTTIAPDIEKYWEDFEASVVAAAPAAVVPEPAAIKPAAIEPAAKEPAAKEPAVAAEPVTVPPAEAIPSEAPVVAAPPLTAVKGYDFGPVKKALARKASLEDLSRFLFFLSMGFAGLSFGAYSSGLDLLGTGMGAFALLSGGIGLMSSCSAAGISIPIP